MIKLILNIWYKWKQRQYDEGDDKLEMVQVRKQKKSKYKDFDNDLMIVHLHICVPIA